MKIDGLWLKILYWNFEIEWQRVIPNEAGLKPKIKGSSFKCGIWSNGKSLLCPGIDRDGANLSTYDLFGKMNFHLWKLFLRKTCFQD